MLLTPVCGAGYWHDQLAWEEGTDEMWVMQRVGVDDILCDTGFMLNEAFGDGSLLALFPYEALSRCGAPSEDAVVLNIECKFDILQQSEILLSEYGGRRQDLPLI